MDPPQWRTPSGSTGLSSGHGGRGYCITRSVGSFRRIDLRHGSLLSARPASRTPISFTICRDAAWADSPLSQTAKVWGEWRSEPWIGSVTFPGSAPNGLPSEALQDGLYWIRPQIRSKSAGCRRHPVRRLQHHQRRQDFHHTAKVSSAATCGPGCLEALAGIEQSAALKHLCRTPVPPVRPEPRAHHRRHLSERCSGYLNWAVVRPA